MRLCCRGNKGPRRSAWRRNSKRRSRGRSTPCGEMRRSVPLVRRSPAVRVPAWATLHAPPMHPSGVRGRRARRRTAGCGEQMVFRPKGQAASGDSCDRLRGSRLNEQTPPPEASATEARRLPAWYLNDAGTTSLDGIAYLNCGSKQPEPHRLRRPCDMRGRLTRCTACRPFCSSAVPGDPRGDIANIATQTPPVLSILFIRVT